MTSADVARRAGVSRSTVSYVLNDNPRQLGRIPEATRSRVREAARDLGYAPSIAARNLQAGRSDWVVLVLPEDPLGPGLTELVDTFIDELAPHGLTVAVRRTDPLHPTERIAAELSPAAIVALVPVNDSTRERVESAGSVVLDGTVDTVDLPGCRSMHRDVGRIQAAHVIAARRDRLAFVVRDDRRLQATAAIRLAGLAAACAEAQVAAPMVIEMDARPGGGARALEAIGSAGLQAACCFDDEVALEVLAAARGAGVRVPEDLAIVGCENSVAGRCVQPGLTSVEMHAGERAEVTADAVLRSTGRDAGRARRVWRPVELVLRGSA